MIEQKQKDLLVRLIDEQNLIDDITSERSYKRNAHKHWHQSLTEKGMSFSELVETDLDQAVNLVKSTLKGINLLIKDQITLYDFLKNKIEIKYLNMSGVCGDCQTLCF